MRVFITLLGVLLLSGCHADPLSGKNDPKDPWWQLGFIEPFYMKVWVEDSAVEDINGQLFPHTGGGSAAGGDLGYDKEWARGWGIQLEVVDGQWQEPTCLSAFTYVGNPS
ncbi:Protein of unknown function [Pseudomonas chlororaphis]|nr:Protein of unknown function [Pseudomonas chlororaphis]